jgi:hypothetical protein
MLADRAEMIRTAQETKVFLLLFLQKKKILTNPSNIFAVRSGEAGVCFRLRRLYGWPAQSRLHCPRRLLQAG